MESFEKAEEDFKERQVREARVEADSDPRRRREGATERRVVRTAQTKSAQAIDRRGQRAAAGLSRRRSSADHASRSTELNEATMKLAENMMNTAVRGALKGTKI